MQIFTQLSEIPRPFEKTAIALGTFDGVHIGHQKIIGRAVELAKQSGSTSVVFTFTNHPLSVIDPKRCPPQIITTDYKAELIADLGVDILLSVPVTKEFLQMAPQEFIDLMHDKLHPAYIVVGPNYHFGFRGAGTPATLQEAEALQGFEAVIHPAVSIQDTLVSSTAIRQYIQQGDVGMASRLLGRPPRFSGLVSTGDGRGRKIGYPTANMVINDRLVTPGNGVYAVRVQVGTERYNGVANVGTNPTFGGMNRRMETHLIDYHGDLYGQTIAVDFLAKLRDEQKFTSVDQLTAQIAADLLAAQKYYG
ncbi:MAG: bifunctional riboflavin kinase/FAD synthetase [Negativicutes bacterium]|nr:bifunctional riboflavin kinase/FAD synthetase [Negativicutes bacterium]